MLESKYYTWNKRGSKMIINTGYKTFDKYITAISHGQCLGCGQFSLFIRPYNETTCNGYDFKLGELRQSDLKKFNDLYYTLRKHIESITQDKGCILYEFYTYKKENKNIVGFIVEQDGNFEIFEDGLFPTRKKNECLKFIVKVLKEEQEYFKRG